MLLFQVELDLKPAALQAIAREAIKKKTGARGLRAILEKLLLDAMFEIPGSDIVSVEIDEDAVFGRGPVKYHYAGAKSKEQEMKNAEDNNAEVKTALAGE